MLVPVIASLAVSVGQLAQIPVRGLHIFAPNSSEIEVTTEFIKNALPKEGVNTLILEIGYGYKFEKRPEIADEGALGKPEIKRIVAACKEAKIRLIPEINLLGHQSWAKTTHKLLTAHPGFDETPGKYPNNEGIYCRSYCPSHPEVHQVIFDLVDELAEVFESDAVHVGMDEVFVIADKDCKRCKGKTPAELFAGEVKKLRDHLKSKNREMWMWGDRFLEGRTTGLGEWEASTNGTDGALASLPTDIVICDWHYEKVEPTPILFAMHGNRVLISPFKDSTVAIGQLDLLRVIQRGANRTLASRMQGFLQTSWCGIGDLINAYYGKPGASKEAVDTAQCFKGLFKAIREG